MGNQNVPEEDGVSHAEELLLVGGEGHGPHWLRVANVHLGRWCRADLRNGPRAGSTQSAGGCPPPCCPTCPGHTPGSWGRPAPRSPTA